jgi:chromosome segregation ATPase
MKSHTPTIEELYDVYIDVNDSFEGALGSMDEIQIELEEGISCLSAALDEIRDELESCRKAFQQLTRRMPSELLAYQNAQEEFWDQPDEGLPFETTTGTT